VFCESFAQLLIYLISITYELQPIQTQWFFTRKLLISLIKKRFSPKLKITEVIKNLEIIVITEEVNYDQISFSLGWREACVIRNIWHKQMSATKPLAIIC